MGTGYTRQSDAEIDDGLTIEAVDLDNEFDAIQAAFNGTTGHGHDGTSGEGPKISLTTSITGILPIANGGIGGLNQVTTTDPTVNEDANDGYVVGSQWINTTTDKYYVCVDNTVGAAIWQRYQLYSVDLTAIAALTSAANKLLYSTGSGTWALTDFSAYGRTLVDDADAATARTTLGLTIGTNVQAYDATLAALASYNTNGFLVQTTSDTFTGRSIAGTTNEITVTNGDGISGDPTISLPSALTFTGKTITGGTYGSGSFSGTWTSGAVTTSNITVTGGTLGGASWTSGAITTSSATITGGSITGITDLAVADGGTGSSTAAGARTNLGLVIGTDVQAFQAAQTQGTWNAGVGTTESVISPAKLAGAITALAPAVGSATTSAAGIVELATDAETQTGTDTVRAITPSNLTAKEATVSNYRANTADRILTTDIVWSSAAEVSLTDAATIAVDMSTFINATVTLGGNRTLGTPSNPKVGQSGYIKIVQDGTGSRTLAYGSNWKFTGGLAPTLTTTAGAIDLLFYQVQTSSFIYASLVKDVK